MRIVKNIEQARAMARRKWGEQADAWILQGVRFVSANKVSPLGNGWNHFSGQGETWDRAFVDAAFNQEIARLKAKELSEAL